MSRGHCWTILPVAISAALLAGCAGGDDPAATSGASSASSPVSSEPGTATDGASSEATATTIAGADLARRMMVGMQQAGTVKVRSEGPTGVTTSQIQYTDGSSSSHATVEMQGSALELIAINNGTDVYVRSPSMGLPTWAKVQADDPNPLVQAIARSIDAMRPMMDPAAGIQIYEQAGSFSNAGPQTIDGVQTTRWTGELPYDAVMSLGTASASAPPDSTSPTSTTPGGAAIPVEVYLDDHDRPIRLTQTLTVAGQRVTTSTSYSDYGADLTVTAPQVGT